MRDCCGTVGGMTIPLILASKSAPRRNVLYSAGVCPTIRVSHVDEPAALEHAAEQAHVSKAGFVKAGFEESKRLHCQNAVDRMCNRNHDCYIPYHIQPFPQQREPYRGKCCADRQQNQQRYFILQ